MNRHPALSIGQRLAITFSVVVLLLGIVGAAVLKWQRDSYIAQQRFTTEIVPRSDQSIALERQVLSVGILIRSYLLQPSRSALTAFEGEVAEVDQHLQRLSALKLDPASAASLAIARRDVSRFLDVAMRAVRAGDRVTFANTVEPELVRAREQAVQSVRSFVSLQEEQRAQALAEITAAEVRVRDGVIAGVIAVALLLVALAFYISRSVRTPAKRLADVAASMQQGDWRPALKLADEPVGRSRDELAILSRAIGVAAVSLEQRERRLKVDRQLANAKASTLDKTRLGELALPIVLEHARAEVGVLYSFEEHSQKLVPVARHAVDASITTLDLGEGIPGQAGRDRAPVLIRDIPADTPFAVRLGIDRVAPRSIAAIPIVFRDVLRGVLLVGSLRDFDDEAMTFLTSAASQLGIGLQNVAAYERIQQLLNEVTEQHQQIQAQNEELQAQNEEIQAQSEEIQAQHEEIQAQNEELARQSDELRQRAQELVLADERKDAFLGVLAHELRNPMAPITNSLYVLKRVVPGSEQARRAEQVIERQTRHLVRLIDDLLDITRISRGKIQLKRELLDLRDVVRTCTQDHEATVEQRRLQLDMQFTDQPVCIHGDRVRLCQLVGNLLNNAIKFTDPNGTIRVTLSVDEQRQQAVLRLSDSGIGMDEQLLKTLFQPFIQGATSLARTNGGLGLGLALVKALAELHQGEVIAHSDGLGKGAEFTVRLPIVASTPNPAGKADARRVNVKPRRILLVEDNVDAARSLSEALSLQGHTVSMAHTGVQGLAEAHRFLPDVVLCDIGLPEVDGYELARRLRDDAHGRRALLVALTGYAAEQDKARATQAGFDEHLAKPADLDRLNEILARFEAHSAARLSNA